MKRTLTALIPVILGVAASAVMAAPASQAPSPTGTIAGRVYNPVLREYVRNAEVRLEGTPAMTYTDADGSFRLAGIAPGPVTITVAYTGYHPVRDTFTLGPGETTAREINLVSTLVAAPEKGDVVRLESFTVSTEREGNAKAIMEQRRNMDITTSVASDIFGDVTDGNVGEFLKFLPGVDLDYVESQPRGPRLGGMDGQYVGVSFDGSRLASADTSYVTGEGTRATSFESFMITSVESIEISRTTSAESDADSPAGTINMKTKRAFDRKGRRLGFNFSLNFNTEEFHLKKTWGPADGKEYKFKPNATLEYSESFLNQRLGVLLSIGRTNSYTEQYQVNHGYNRSPSAADPRPLVLTSLSTKDGPATILKDALMLTADFKATPRLVLSLNAIYNMAETEYWNRNFNWVAANSNANVNNGRSTVGGDGLTTIRSASSARNTAPVLNNAGVSAAKITTTRTVTPKFEYKLDEWVFDGTAGYSRSVAQADTLERGFSASDGGSIAGDWIGTRPNANSQEWTIRQVSGADWFDLGSFRGGTQVDNGEREASAEIWSGQLNARWTLPFLRAWPTTLKAGGKWAEETRQFHNTGPWQVWSYVGPGGDTITGFNAATGLPTIATTGNWANLGFITPHVYDTGTTNALRVFNLAGAQGMPPRPSRNAMATLFHAQPELFVRNAAVNDYYNAMIANSRDFRQTVTAGYVQADTRVTAKLQVRTGLRYENTANEGREFNPRTPSELTRAGFAVASTGRAATIPGLDYQYFSQPQVTRESEYHNWFPSLLAKYSLSRNVQLQAGLNKAISRPPISNLTGVWTIQEDIQRVTAPNVALMPEYSKNAQARLAWYFEPSGQFTLGVSQNNIRNLRQSYDYTAEEFGVNDPAFADYVFRSTSNSLEQRRFRNVEIDYRQTLSFLPEILKGTSVSLTYVRSYANVRRPNLAPHRVSSRLGYAYRRFNGFIGMVWTDDRPYSNEGRYQRHLAQFDTQLNWRLTRQFTLFAQGRNITKAPVRWFESPPGVAEGRSGVLYRYDYYGANWVFGVKGTF